MQRELHERRLGVQSEGRGGEGAGVEWKENREGQGETGIETRSRDREKKGR